MKIFKAFFKLGILVLIITQFSCRKDFSTITSNGNLSFSVDTLFLDTVFNNLSTTTHYLSVYNNNKKDILIPQIKLENNNSKYRIAVDGTPGITFNNVLLRGNDSLYIKVETTASAADTDDMLYKDKILFDPNGTSQHIDLVTLVKEANLLFPDTGTDFELSQNTFTKDKPYVVYGNAIVPKNGSLTIEAGSIVHFSDDASLNISEGATLNINGALTDSIVFKGDKLSYVFKEIAGQWNGIKIAKNTNININYLKILNPTIGLEITENSNNAIIQNTEIYNAGKHGIYTKNAKITGSNLVIGQTRKSALYLQGGDYTFNHCTFANYWSKGIRTESNITLTNSFVNDDDSKTNVPLNSANFNNSIVAGSKPIELSLEKDEDEAIFNFNFKNCLLNIDNIDEDIKNKELYDLKNTSFYSDILKNKETDFKDISKNDLRIGLDNEGINKANINIANTIPKDITGTDRTVTPDIGAYQHIDFKTLEPKKEDE